MQVMTIEQLESFKWRFYNTFKSVILPIILLQVYQELQSNPNDLGCLFTKEFINALLYAVVLALVGSLIAGAEKVSRMKRGVV